MCVHVHMFGHLSEDKSSMLVYLWGPTVTYGNKTPVTQL